MDIYLFNPLQVMTDDSYSLLQLAARLKPVTTFFSSDTENWSGINKGKNKISKKNR